jgi:hypothetical protein
MPSGGETLLALLLNPGPLLLFCTAALQGEQHTTVSRREVTKHNRNTAPNLLCTAALHFGLLCCSL